LLWKSQRENRKNRSYLRDFWYKKDGVESDEHHTFRNQEGKTKIHTRGFNIKVKIKNYSDCFCERENAVEFCKELENMHNSIKIACDITTLEDLEFDKLIGKAPNKVVQDSDFQNMMPFISKEEEQKLAEEYPHNIVETYMNNDATFKSKCLQLTVQDVRYFHKRLSPPVVEPFI